MSVKHERELEHQRSWYHQICVEELVWPEVVRWVWAINENSNTDARYQNCLIFWASRCTFASNSQHIIIFLDWILYFFWLLKWRPKFEFKIYCVFSNLSSYRIEFCFSMVTLVMMITQRLSLISSCSRKRTSHGWDLSDLVIDWSREWMNERKWVSEWIVLFEKKNKLLFSYIFVYQKNHPNIVLVQLNAKAKPLATFNK